MVVKLVALLLVLAVVLSVAVVASYWYLAKRAEQNHEKDMKKMEQTEKLFEDDF